MEEWSESAKSIIEMGKKLMELRKTTAREDLGKKAFADYGISIHSIDKIIKIAQHPVLSDPELMDKLPNSWALLYEARFLPDDLLREKIQNGELETATKYKIWEWRGVKAKRHDGYVSKNEGNQVRVPDNVTLVAYVNAGMQKEKEFDGDLPAVAKCLGIGSWTFRQVRQIILLSQHPDLSNSDKEMVQSLIDKINKTRNVQKYYLQAKPLIEKIWGGTRGQRITPQKHQKRVESYMDSVFLLGMSAQKLSDIDRPYMSIEDTDKVIGELSEAGTIIRKLAETFRRSKND